MGEHLAGSAGLAKGHSCSGRASFNAGAWRLHLTHLPNNTTNLQDL